MGPGMFPFRRMSALLFVLATALPASPSTRNTPGQGFPDPGVFIRQVRDAVRLDYELQSQFTYTEERRDVRVSPLGKVEVGPLRTFEVFPSSRPGRTYKRLVAVDGKPLSPDELARRDREHEQHLAKLDERERRETLQDRAERLEEARKELAERDAILDDVLAVFEPAFEARELIDGQEVFVIALTPREHARVTTRVGRWLRDFAGRVWIAEAGRQIVRVELRAEDDVTIGWGILGRVHEGSRFTFSRRRVGDAWLPAEVVFDASGRTLLFRRFDIDLVTTYSNYERIQ